MKQLVELLKNVKIVKKCGAMPLEITDLAIDCKKVKNGGIFIAVRGSAANGNDYIFDALKNGAALIVSDDERALKKGIGNFSEKETGLKNRTADAGGEITPKEESGNYSENETQNVCGGEITPKEESGNYSENGIEIPYIIVEDAREAYAFIAANYFGNPAAGMRFIGISGTNGKTTIAHMIYHILYSNGIKTGLIGTIGNIIDGLRGETDMTTPDPYELFAVLKKMRDCGTEVVVSEVSAHAIYLKKINPIIADVAVFTNCSQDHIDFFKTMEKYAEVKKSYFTKKHARSVVINADDSVGVEIINGSDAKVISYGIKNPSDVFAINIRLSMAGSGFFANLFDDVEEIRLPIPGLFNVYNALAAMTAARLLNISLKDSAESLLSLPEIPGRFNLLTAEKCGFVIDYAHSPDGLKKILIAARGITKGRLICVFGCGGNRDKIKRPIMGRVAADYGDFTILTSDNPRFEEPEDIIRDIENGLKGITDQYMNIIDREKAIKKAYEIAGKNDLIVVAGKGAEDYIDIKGVKYEYGDRRVIEEIIASER
ncbi:MAG: UDP-N-acetylmuramoyl-L-alanyl-D-glutamate--2,6-diaminopimelate ligase [Clostridiales bacterium]|jgi:UDP-N-acetylmuramoyl-L-alanyl-D-glutamate--2,6-diaminopimelate ligase|nr:UDP-N-acetylmuramoyl-L-alanyl-D-glutamate--2,6-diaminopimelate ligase [Clostridiales bacterium]